MTMTATAPRRFPRAAPDGLIASVLLAFLATAGLFYVNIMAAIVAGVHDGLGVTEQQAGWVGSANIYGAAPGALGAVFLVKRIAWRPFAIAALVALICLLVIVLGVKLGRWKLMALAMAFTLAGTFAFHWSRDPMVFLIANIGTAITWSFVISDLLGMSAEFDRAGRTAAMAGFASKMGLASGPFFGGLLIGDGSYALLINASVLLLLLSTLAMLAPAALLDRERMASARA